MTAASSDKACCAVGQPASDNYLPKGKIRKVGDWDAYQVGPAFGDLTPGLEPLGHILLIPDGFGLVQHNYVLADTFAVYGWSVTIPDIYEGDPIPSLILRRNDPGLSDQERSMVQAVDVSQWLAAHPHDRVEHVLRGFLRTLTSQSAGFGLCAGINVAGYCFGGKHALRLSSSENVRAVASFHPIHVEKEDLAGLSSPIFIGLGEKDDMVPASLRLDLEKWIDLASCPSVDSRKWPVELTVYPQMNHGFAARPDTTNGSVKAQYVRSLTDTIRFFARSSFC